MIRNRFLLLLVLPMLALAGCGKEGTEPQTPGTNDTGAIKFEIGFVGQDGTQTRVATAADFTSTFEDGDKIGIFAVLHGEDPAPSDPIHNVPLTYDKAAGTWSGEAYWPDGVDMLDFYAYYPYSAEATDPTALMFAVSADQSGTTDGRSNYNLSDLLAARSSNGGAGWAEGAPVSLSFSHELAMVQLAIDEEADGIDFTKDVTVTLQGVIKTMTFGIASWLNSPSGDPGDVVMHLAATDGTKRLYRALVPAQTVAAETKLFHIENGDQTLTSDALTADLTLTPARAELFTLSGAAPDTPVTIAPIEGITAPVAGATPQTTVPETSQYTGTIQWIRDDNSEVITSPFVAGTIYRAAITLTAKDGYTFEGLSVFEMLDGFTVNGIVPFNVTPVSDTEITVSVLFDNKRIIPAPLTGLTAPATGAAPDWDVEDTEGYEVNLTAWWDVVAHEVLSGSTFEAGKVYGARIYINAKEGWQFAVNNTDEWEEYVEGFLPEGTFLTDPIYHNVTKATTISCLLTFPATGAPPATIEITPQNKTVFTGTVTYDVTTSNIADNTPVSIEWCDAQGAAVDPWGARLQSRYGPVINNKVELELTVSDGVAAGDYYFKLSAGGATSDLIKITVMERTSITPAPLTGIVRPVTDQIQSMTINNGENYTAVLNLWLGNFIYNYQFKAGEVYQAKITLRAAEGYTFRSITDFSGFKPADAESISDFNRRSDSEITLDITYPATE